MAIQDIQTAETIPTVEISGPRETAPIAEISRSAATTAPLKYYYDFHPTKKDLMGQSNTQDAAIDYLRHVLKYYYREEGWYIAVDLNMYKTRRYRERPLAPDIAVFVGVPLSSLATEHIPSWQLVLPGRPSPKIVFEFASDSSIFKDLESKPGRYAEMGVEEYICYDPRPAPHAVEVRLRAWTYRDGQRQELTPDDRGWIWSEILQSWLVPDGVYLRLYDRDGQQRLTGEEAARMALGAERAAREVERAAREVERAAREVERAAKEEALAAIEAERVAKQEALAAIEAERTAREEALAAIERVRARLRDLGIDPDTV